MAAAAAAAAATCSAFFIGHRVLVFQFLYHLPCEKLIPHRTGGCWLCPRTRRGQHHAPRATWETCYFRYNHVFFLVQTRIIHVSPRITSYHVRIGPIPADTGIGPVSAKKRAFFVSGPYRVRIGPVSVANSTSTRYMHDTILIQSDTR